MKTSSIILTAILGIGVGIVLSRMFSSQKENHTDVDEAINKVISKNNDDELSLQEAIEKEDYEQAAAIRDRMKK